MDRRDALRSVTAALTIGLAGCGGGDDGGDSPSETATPTETPTEVPTDTPTEAPTETPTETPTQTPTETPTDTPTDTSTEEPTETPTETPTGPQTQVVTVGPNGSLRFSPESFTISVGDTVRWEWDSDTHNVTPDDIPSASAWVGTTGDDQYTYDAGHTYSHTFEVAGEYTYFCDPHKASGMRGSFTVEE